MRFAENGDLWVKAPNRVSDAAINNFLHKHKSWIEKNFLKFTQKQRLKETYDFESNVYIMGKEIKVNKKEERMLYYTEFFDTYIENRVEELSKIYNLTYKSVKCCNSVRIWGSLDKEKNMKLNIKLSILPAEMIDYVIIHELCHGIEFNHSKRFWKAVESIIPNYKSVKTEMKKFDFLLRECIY